MLAQVSQIFLYALQVQLRFPGTLAGVPESLYRRRKSLVELIFTAILLRIDFAEVNRSETNQSQTVRGGLKDFRRRIRGSWWLPKGSAASTPLIPFCIGMPWHAVRGWGRDSIHFASCPVSCGSARVRQGYDKQFLGRENAVDNAEGKSSQDVEAVSIIA
jgi:hypothetical protein